MGQKAPKPPSCPGKDALHPGRGPRLLEVAPGWRAMIPGPAGSARAPLRVPGGAEPRGRAARDGGKETKQLHLVSLAGTTKGIGTVRVGEPPFGGRLSVLRQEKTLLKKPELLGCGKIARSANDLIFDREPSLEREKNKLF